MAERITSRLSAAVADRRSRTPLILDDPLVDLDDLRTDRFLDLLLELAENVQILLFTKNQEIRSWFGRRCGGEGERHKLTQLPVSNLNDPG